ncbi:MAG: DUF45 domain-containing protein [Chloroflexi bacterium]|nr:DUF45 domain-containing protein [Chloroflexota bacterium]
MTKGDGLRWKGIEYSVRENSRARRVILRVSSANRLDVVVPRRFNRRRLPEIFQAHRDWIQRELQKVQDQPSPAAPRQIELNAIGERWRVEYRGGIDVRIHVEEKTGNILAVARDAGDFEAIAADLTGWLHRKAHAHLAPWLRQVSLETGISFKKITVRGQATRWASCSKLQNISLNRSLLYLPPPLVRHVFLHELCHIKRLDHSPDFWRLLQDMEPNCRALETEVKQADRYVPSWVRMARPR